MYCSLIPINRIKIKAKLLAEYLAIKVIFSSQTLPKRLFFNTSRSFNSNQSLDKNALMFIARLKWKFRAEYYKRQFTTNVRFRSLFRIQSIGDDFAAEWRWGKGEGVNDYFYERFGIQNRLKMFWIFAKLPLNRDSVTSVIKMVQFNHQFRKIFEPSPIFQCFRHCKLFTAFRRWLKVICHQKFSLNRLEGRFGFYKKSSFSS